MNPQSPRREREGEQKVKMHAQPLLLSHLPTRGQSARQWGDNITTVLVQLWLPKLSDVDRCWLIAFGVNAPFYVSIKALVAFDQLLLEQASVTGLRIGMSPLVQRRFIQWEFERGGPQKVRAYGDACALAMERFRGQRPMPWDPDQYFHRQETVEELFHLLAMIDQDLKPRGSVEEKETKLAEVFLYVIAKQKKYKNLRADWDAWSLFFAKQEHRTLLRVCMEESKAGLLYDSLISVGRRIQPESVGQAISRLKP